MNKLQYKLSCMICYMSKIIVQLNFPLFCLQIVGCLCCCYCLCVFSFFCLTFSINCCCSIEIRFVLCSIKLPSLYIVCYAKLQRLLGFFPNITPLQHCGFGLYKYQLIASCLWLRTDLKRHRSVNIFKNHYKMCGCSPFVSTQSHFPADFSLTPQTRPADLPSM